MTDLGLGKKYDLMRNRNRELNRIAVSLREHPIICSWCKSIMGYGSVPNSHGICQDCGTKSTKIGNGVIK